MSYPIFWILNFFWSLMAFFLDLLVTQVSNILSVGSNNIGVEATKGVAPPAVAGTAGGGMKGKATGGKGKAKGKSK